MAALAPGECAGRGDPGAAGMVHGGRGPGTTMESILLVIHVLLGLAIVGLIMIQQGKGAEMGASFGAGASQTVFGAAGTGNFFSRLTAILVTGFFATSIILAWMSKERVDRFELDIPVIEDVRSSAPPADDVVPAAQSGGQGNSAAPAIDPVPGADLEPATPPTEVPAD